MRNEEGIAWASFLQPAGNVAIQCEPRGWMQWQQPALFELGLDNDQSIFGHVRQPDGERLRNAESGRRDQTEHCGVCKRPN